MLRKMVQQKKEKKDKENKPSPTYEVRFGSSAVWKPSTSTELREGAELAPGPW